MKLIISAFIISFFFAFRLFSQENPNLKVIEFELENGMKVFLNPDRSSTKVFGAVAVNAGSKQDPADATGIAHYLEHLLFKGTTELGTWNYEAEKPYLDSINKLYDQLPGATEEERTQIQLKINEQAMEAGKYGLPNEFDNLLKSIGSTEVNAFTMPDMTYYHNSFPPDQILKWIDIYSHRFQNPVFRSFQSELEVVYEEKNRSEDDFQTQIFEIFSKHLFPGHPYGTQTTLGTTEHLKNPSLTKMYEFFNSYYVANNMALILCGNFDPKLVEPAIREKFGKLKSGKVPEFPNYDVKQPEGRKLVKARLTPINVGVLGFNTVPANHPDRYAISVLNYLLSNENKTGTLDQLIQENKLMFGMAMDVPYLDQGASVLIFIPKILVQSLKKAENLVLECIKPLREGNFGEDILTMAKNNLSQEFEEMMEDPEYRGNEMGTAYIQGQKWSEYQEFPERIAAVTKEDVMRVAEKYFGKNYLAFWSKMGFPAKSKLQKPEFKPVIADRTQNSDYAKRFANIEEIPLEPRFLDFEKDARSFDLGNKNQLYVVPNPINDIFSLDIIHHVGDKQIKNLEAAASLINYSGTPEYSLTDLQKALEKAATTLSVSADESQMTLHLTGSEKNLPEALRITGLLIKSPVPAENSMKLVQNEYKTGRRIEKRTPSEMGVMLLNYGVHGKDSRFLSRPTMKEISIGNAGDWIAKFKEATGYAASYHFTGNTPADHVNDLILENLPISTTGKKENPVFREGIQRDKNIIYFVNDPKAVQSQVYFYVKGNEYNPENIAPLNAFNSYFGGGFSGLVVQEIREYRSLAYSTSGRIQTPPLPGKPKRLIAFIGCQADKTPEAVDVMMDLITNLPQKPERVDMIRNYLKYTAFSDFPQFRYRSQFIENYKTLGLSKDPNIAAYQAYKDLEFDEIMNFYSSEIQGRPVTITIYGDKNKINLESLKKYGEIVELKQKDVVVW